MAHVYSVLNIKRMREKKLHYHGANEKHSSRHKQLLTYAEGLYIRGSL
jgi:hypothetical protein